MPYHLQRDGDHGITTFDTAPFYGFELSEELISKAVASRARSRLRSNQSRLALGIEYIIHIDPRMTDNPTAKTAAHTLASDFLKKGLGLTGD